MFAGRPITEITIPASVTSIQHNAFEGCNKLSRVTFESGTNPLTIDYQYSAFDEVGPFYQSPLSYIKLDRKIVPTNGYQEKLDKWDMGVFTNSHYNDDDLTTSVHLGTNVKTILPWMFSCVRVRQIWIPQEITSIGKGAFAYCYIFDGLTCNHTTPPTLGENAFYRAGEDTSAGKVRYISVIKGAKSAFVAAKGWKDYANIITEWTPAN